MKQWSSSYYFLAAAIGTAVGISNIWKFSYVAGANGGGAFMFIYLLSLFCIAVPALVAEMVIGRRGGNSMVATIDHLVVGNELHRGWRVYAPIAMTGVFIILSYYCVIAGWTVDYFFMALGDAFSHRSQQEITALFESLLANPGEMMLFQGIFILATAVIVATGLNRGVERTLGTLTPILFAILLVLLVYAIMFSEFGAAARFLLYPDWSKIDSTVIIMAVGQAFFSLGVGLGVMMTIGAYMNRDIPLFRSTLIIAGADGLAAILAGLAIFPFVFAHDLSPAEGPGLLFLTLPTAFGQMPGGTLVSPAFFFLLACAALTSSVILLEAIIACIEERIKKPRWMIVGIAATLLWLLGLGTVFSFNIWQDVRPLAFLNLLPDKDIFGVLDYISSNILMPLGGILVCVMAGWILNTSSVAAELELGEAAAFKTWRVLIRYVVPLFVAVVFIVNLN